MTPTDIPREFNLDTPATYRIRVRGRLGRSWANLLNNVQIAPDAETQETKVTTLIGYLPDQAALSGVLNTLYDRQVPLLSVENLDEKK